MFLDFHQKKLSSNADIKFPYYKHTFIDKTNKCFFLSSEMIKKTRRGSPVDRRPLTTEAPPIGKIRHFSEMAVTFKPPMGF